jgi:hypothetical protein
VSGKSFNFGNDDVENEVMKFVIHILKLLPLIISIVVLICYITIPEVYIYLKLEERISLLIPLIGFITIMLYNHKLRNAIIYWLLMCLVIVNVRPILINDIETIKKGDYFLSSGIINSGFIETHGFGYDHNNTYVSLQTGNKAYLKVCKEAYYEKRPDTVILRLAYELPNYIFVHNANPTHSEIQKFMEPVLFLDGVEQQRPKYNELDFSNDERRLYMYLSHPQIVKVVSKQKDEFLRNLVTLQINDTTQITVNLMYKDVMSYVDENDLDKFFNSIDVNGRGVIAKVSNINPRVVEVTKWNPTGTDYSFAFDKKTQVDTALENELMKKSVKQLGCIINKHKEESWTSRHKKKVKYYATVCVNDTIDRTFEITGKDNQNLYNNINQGDAVLVRVSEIFSYAVRILNWRPTPEEIEKYRQ